MTQSFRIDLTHIETPYELYHLFMDTFDFPDYFGHNADALWDCLWEKFFLNFDIVTTITLSHLQPVNLALSIEIPIVLRVFKRLHGQYNVTVLVELDDGTQMDISDYMAPFGIPET